MTKGKHTIIIKEATVEMAYLIHAKPASGSHGAKEL